jgi:hypothetical protein
MKLAAADNLWQVKNSALTSWRNPIQMRDRYTAIDSITMRQQLGEISKDEVAEVNRVLGSPFVSFSKDRRQPAKLWAWDNLTTGALLLSGLGFTTYGLLGLKSNKLWIIAAPIPAFIYYKINGVRQDQDLIQNAYRYLLAKRSATAEFEQNQASVARSEHLHTALTQSKFTLYELEQQIVAKIEHGQL